jgi:hypothetical protein
MDISEFIEEHRQELIEAITGQESIMAIDLDDEEIENWVLNDESLYTWVVSEGVEI